MLRRTRALFSAACLVVLAALAGAVCSVGAVEGGDQAKADIVPLFTSQSREPVAGAVPGSEANASVVDLGGGHEYLPPASGPLVVPREERAPRGAYVTKGVSRPGDPEWVRGSPDDTEPAPQEQGPAQRGAPKRDPRTRPGDPEEQRVLPDDPAPAPGAQTAPRPPTGGTFLSRRPGDPELARPVPVAVEAEPEPAMAQTDSASNRATETRAGDAPRFVSGAGLDEEAAEIVADLALSEHKAAASAEAAEPGKEVVPPEDRATARRSPGVPPGREVHGRDAHATELGAVSGETAGTEDKRGKRPLEPPQPVDLEKKFQELIEQVRRNNERLRQAAGAARDTTVHGLTAEGTGVRVRDPRAARFLETILRDTPLGTVAGTITDATGTRPLPARVRVMDITDTSLEAPLPEGFWCAGRFNTQVVSGPVRVEVSRGRFYPSFVKGMQVKAHAVTPFAAALARPAALNFAAQGWHLADLDLGLRAAPGERPVWLGEPPGLDALVLAAQGEGVQILGVPVPWGEASSEQGIEALAAASSEVLLLPVFPGPRHAFCGRGLGLGMRFWAGLPLEVGAPEVPLRDTFEELRARGGLVAFSELNGSQRVDIRRDILSLFPRLEKSGFYPQDSGTARLYAANELPFDTVTGPAYDVIALDGSPSAEHLWFNLLNQGYSLSVIGAGGGSLAGGRLPYGQTFIGVEGPLSRDKALAAIRQGHTGVSFGPAVFCKILERDKGPGSMLPADGRRLTLQVQAYSSMWQGMQLDRVEIIRNGELVHTQTAGEGETQVNNLCWPVSETSSAWYVVRVTERCNTPGASHKPGTAWTGALYFRGPGFAAPQPAVSRITGTLCAGLTPVAGTVTVVVPGQLARQVAADRNGRFKVELPASGSLVFEAPGCEPLAKRVFEHPRVQQALGALQSEREGPLRQQFEKASLFPAWRLLLADLEWNVSLLPAAATLFREPETTPAGKE